MSLSTIVGDEKLPELQDKLKQLDLADKEIELMTRAGIDTTDAKKQSKEARDALLKIKNAYWPGQ